MPFISFEFVLCLDLKFFSHTANMPSFKRYFSLIFQREGIVKKILDCYVYSASIEQSDRLILNTLTVDIEQSER